MADARIPLIRDALVMAHGLYLADVEIRTLLAALDKVGPPVLEQTVTLPARCANCEGAGFIASIDGKRRPCKSCNSLPHAYAHRRVESCAQDDADDYHGRLTPGDCDCAGLCAGVPSNSNLNARGLRCRRA